MLSVPRSIRIDYPGAFYHVMARGNRREKIFRSDYDGKLFLDTLGEACGEEKQIRRASFTAAASDEDVVWGEAWESLWARESV